MNKIIIDKTESVELKDNTFNLEIKIPKIILNIKGNVLINEIVNNQQDNIEIIINVNKNSSLLYNRFLLSEKIISNITINQEDYSNVVFNYSIIAHNKGQISFRSNIKGNNNNTNIDIRAVTEQLGSLKISCVSNTKERIFDNKILEDIRILLLNNEENIIIPDLLVSSNEIEVNHAATMSGIKEDELFYLQSKGLSVDAATNLIKIGYLINNLEISEEEKEKIKQIIGR